MFIFTDFFNSCSQYFPDLFCLSRFSRAYPGSEESQPLQNVNNDEDLNNFKLTFVKNKHGNEACQFATMYFNRSDKYENTVCIAEVDAVACFFNLVIKDDKHLNFRKVNVVTAVTNVVTSRGLDVIAGVASPIIVLQGMWPYITTVTKFLEPLPDNPYTLVLRNTAVTASFAANWSIGTLKAWAFVRNTLPCLVQAIKDQRQADLTPEETKQFRKMLAYYLFLMVGNIPPQAALAYDSVSGLRDNCVSDTNMVCKEPGYYWRVGMSATVVNSTLSVQPVGSKAIPELSSKHANAFKQFKKTITLEYAKLHNAMNSDKCYSQALMQNLLKGVTNSIRWVYEDNIKSKAIKYTVTALTWNYSLGVGALAANLVASAMPGSSIWWKMLCGFLKYLTLIVAAYGKAALLLEPSIQKFKALISMIYQYREPDVQNQITCFKISRGRKLFLGLLYTTISCSILGAAYVIENNYIFPVLGNVGMPWFSALLLVLFLIPFQGLGIDAIFSGLYEKCRAYFKPRQFDDIASVFQFVIEDFIGLDEEQFYQEYTVHESEPTWLDDNSIKLHFRESIRTFQTTLFAGIPRKLSNKAIRLLEDLFRIKSLVSDDVEVDQLFKEQHNFTNVVNGALATQQSAKKLYEEQTEKLAINEGMLEMDDLGHSQNSYIELENSHISSKDSYVDLSGDIQGGNNNTNTSHWSRFSAVCNSISNFCSTSSGMKEARCFDI